MRLFAALLPPPDISADLASAVGELRKLPGAEALTWTGRPGWHFTLAFYGEVAEETVPELSERLARAARRTEVFPLLVQGGGAFGQGHALWVGANGEVESMRLLADRAEAAGRRAGLTMQEHRRYRPHLTLARGRGSVDLGPYVAALDSFASRTWEVAELVLVRSHLPRSGIAGEQPRYEPVGTWALGAGA
ncbi:RNA 2',3'-cyclic phosphodiesterase [Streptomyces cavernae]|uniref:RNA 2',3'-cyclic phosphodiesterase n=1 Tax=Streptomyces cavernae TaxID=2259034 RepID=UPI000FEB692F|nr:RNA 2',3'-cyclic phosphodiesterase [Streptomyces cavernae]